MITGEADINVLVGKRIRELRTLKNLTPIALAVRCGMERSNLSRIEAGRTNPTLSTLNKIAKGLEITLHELVKVG